MQPEISALAEIYNLNTRLFHNCLEGIDDDFATRRPSNDTNNIAFIATHLADARYALARYLGHVSQSPFPELTAVQKINEITNFPKLKDIEAAWSAISPALADLLATVSEDRLRSPSSMRFPVADSTVLGGIAFLLQHESFHLGQLALLRKYFGCGAMKY